MKYGHAVGISIFSVVAMVLLGESGIMPYSFSMPVTLFIGALAVFYWQSPEWVKDKTNFNRKGKDLTVDPNEALEWLQNEHIPTKPGYRKLNLDKTDKNNKQLYTKVQPVTQNGEEKVKWGVVGRPMHQFDKETIAYVIHCDEGWVQYSGELHDAESRMDPFNGQHKWLVTEGYNAKVENEKPDNRGGKGSVNIYQGPSNQEMQE